MEALNSTATIIENDTIGFVMNTLNENRYKEGVGSPMFLIMLAFTMPISIVYLISKMIIEYLNRQDRYEEGIHRYAMIPQTEKKSQKRAEKTILGTVQLMAMRLIMILLHYDKRL